MSIIQFIRRRIVWVRHNRLKTAAIVAIILVILFFVRPRPQAPVSTVKAENGTITLSLSVTGSIASEHQVDLNFLTAGKLVYLPVKKGDHVSAGEVIATEDERTVEENLQNALRDYAKQRNTFEQTRDNYQDATPDTALNDAAKRILQNNQYDLDKAVISVQLQDLARQNAVLTSPIDGYLTRLDANAAGMNIGATTVFEITDLDHLTFNMDVDESDIGKVIEGQPVKVTLDSFPNATLTLQVDSIDLTSHTTSTGGTAYTVYVKLPQSAGQYRVGMSGDADIVLDERRHILKIPISAIVDNTYVYKKTTKGFVKQEIKLGLQNDTDAEVESGLSEDDEVATQPTSLAKNQIIASR